MVKLWDQFFRADLIYTDANIFSTKTKLLHVYQEGFPDKAYSRSFLPKPSLWTKNDHNICLHLAIRLYVICFRIAQSV